MQQKEGAMKTVKLSNSKSTHTTNLKAKKKDQKAR